MGDEQQSDEDIQRSTAHIPVIKKESCDVTYGGIPEDSGIIFASRSLEEKADQTWPPVIYAPLGNPEFWLEFHIGHFEYVLRRAERIQTDALIAEARNDVLEANVKREYEEKMKLAEALKAENHDKIGIFMRYIHRIYLHRLEESNRELAEEDLAKANARIKAHESNEFAYSLAMLGLSDKIEEQAALINEYAKRFGSPELLRKLKEAEENCAMKRRHCITEDYNCISRLLEHHGAGKCPKTTGQRVVDFLEKIANPDTYYNIANAVCSALRKKK